MIGAYIFLSIAIFLGQLQNGFFTALLTGIFWPILAIYMLISFLITVYKLDKTK